MFKQEKDKLKSMPSYIKELENDIVRLEFIIKFQNADIYSCCKQENITLINNFNGVVNNDQNGQSDKNKFFNTEIKTNGIIQNLKDINGKKENVNGKAMNGNTSSTNATENNLKEQMEELFNQNIEFNYDDDFSDLNHNEAIERKLMPNLFQRVFVKKHDMDFSDVFFEIQILESFLEKSSTFSLEVEDFFIRYHGFYFNEDQQNEILTINLIIERGEASAEDVGQLLEKNVKSPYFGFDQVLEMMENLLETLFEMQFQRLFYLTGFYYIIHYFLLQKHRKEQNKILQAHQRYQITFVEEGDSQEQVIFQKFQTISILPNQYQIDLESIFFIEIQDLAKSLIHFMTLQWNQDGLEQNEFYDPSSPIWEKVRSIYNSEPFLEEFIFILQIILQKNNKNQQSISIPNLVTKSGTILNPEQCQITSLQEVFHMFYIFATKRMETLEQQIAKSRKQTKNPTSQIGQGTIYFTPNMMDMQYSEIQLDIFSQEIKQQKQTTIKPENKQTPQGSNLSEESLVFLSQEEEEKKQSTITSKSPSNQSISSQKLNQTSDEATPYNNQLFSIAKSLVNKIQDKIYDIKQQFFKEETTPNTTTPQQNNNSTFEFQTSFFNNENSGEYQFSDYESEPFDENEQIQNCCDKLENQQNQQKDTICQQIIENPSLCNQFKR